MRDPLFLLNGKKKNIVLVRFENNDVTVPIGM